MPKSSKPRKKYIKQREKRIGLPEYYIDAFFYYDKKYLDDFDKQILSFREKLRLTYADKLKDGYTGIFSGEAAYNILLGNLNYLSEEMEKKIKHKSPIYWMHLYRRIGLGLVVEEGEHSDSSVLFSVRYYVETAILKYSNLNSTDDLCLSNDISYTDILDGLFYENLSNQGIKEQEINRIWKEYQKKPNWVLSKFKRGDIKTIYFLEGIAYEYWKTAALMRAVSKGSSISIDTHGFWTENRPDNINRLIVRFDTRLARGKSYISTAKGLFSLSKVEEQEFYILAAAYNASRESFDQVVGPNKHINKGVVTNFLPQRIDFKTFLSDHSIFIDLYKEKYQIHLENVFFCLKILFDIIVLSRSLPAQGIESTKDRSLITAHQFLQRAYAFVDFSIVELCDDIVKYAEMYPKTLGINIASFVEDLPRILEILQLDSNVQKDISIWSFGPRPILIPYKQNLLIDGAGIWIILRNMFFGLKEDTKQRGIKFEDIVRDAIQNKGYDLLNNRKLTAFKKVYRETDLAIRINDTLVLIDCRSMETPIRLDIGHYSSLEYRNREVIRKNDQVISIAEFVKQYPKGNNYDFTWATTIISFAVTVDVEWIPTEDHTFWLDEEKNIPIVMSVEECFTFLDELRGNN